MRINLAEEKNEKKEGENDEYKYNYEREYDVASFV